MKLCSLCRQLYVQNVLDFSSELENLNQISQCNLDENITLFNIMSS